jgi:hypothetical protein
MTEPTTDQERPMTTVAVDWVTLSTSEFVAWTRLEGVGLPFPLSSGAQSFVPGPSRDELASSLADRELADSPVLTAIRAAFAAPRLAVYAVRATPDGAETKYFAVADHGAHAALILLDSEKVALRAIADTELAAGVVGALPPMTPLRFDACEVTVGGMLEVDAAIDAGVSPRTLHSQMSHVGFSEELIAVRERAGNDPATSGAVGALAYADTGTAQPRHSTRSATWREYDEGAVLHVERGPRHGEATVLLTACTPDALFRAAVDAVSSLYEAGS